MKSVLLDIVGLELTAEEREMLGQPTVFGVILFARNYSDPIQLKSLTTDIHQLNPHLRIVTDQEGGRVQRFRAQFTELPSMRHWGQQFQHHQQQALTQLRTTLTTMVKELHAVGVQATLMPVLDIDYGRNTVVGERSFGPDPHIITQLARVVIEVLKAHGMPATGKHFPGHGAVTVDSHEQLPIDPRNFAEIWANDLLPYRHLIAELEMIMPAHIIYPAIDKMPAGFSAVWLQQILRQQLGFAGLIISDDISMQATTGYGSYAERAMLAWRAGCDVVTVCNNRAGALEVLQQAVRLN